MRTPFGPLRIAGVTCGLFLLAGSPARSARVTDLASSFDENSIVNFDVRLGYQRSLKRSAIKREFSGRDASGVELVKDLRFNQIRHTLSVRGDFSLWKALQVYLEFPIIIADTRWVDFAQNNGNPCTTDPPTCVSWRNSTLSRDGLIDADALQRVDPQGTQVPLAGPDGVAGGLTLPVRSGIDQMIIGLSGMPLSQERDSTKPTWVIGFEARIGIGKDMEYNPLNPSANTGVGQGVHQFMWWTSVSHRFKYLDPWFTVFYLLPSAKSGSLFEKTSFAISGQERSGPMHRGGSEIGLEIIPYERPEKHQRISIELSGRMEGVFEGRGYSDIWEIFSHNPRLAGPCRPTPDSMMPGAWGNGTYCANPGDTIPYPGITNIENYAIFTGSLAVAAEITKYFRARIGVSLGHELQHAITFGDAGRSGTDAREKGGACEGTPYGELCARNEAEMNPMYRPLIDSPGRRFQVAESTLFDLFLSVSGQY
jgi:hypothetical protein